MNRTITLPIAETTVRFATCYAAFTGRELVLGNAEFERRWRVEDGLLYPTSFRDVAAGREWLAHPATLPAPYPDVDVPDEPRTVTCRAQGGPQGPTEEPSLVVELNAVGAALTLRYRFQVFATVRGVTVQLATEGGKGMMAVPGPSSAPEATGIEVPAMRPHGDWHLPTGDMLEYLTPNATHVKLTQVVLFDQTDVHNELVFANEWLLHPNESKLALQGNLFALEDPLTGDGLLFVKQAPLPPVRPHKTEADFRVSGTSGCLYVPPEEQRAFGPTHPRFPLAYQCAFYGHGTGATSDTGYPYTLFAYSGGHTGRTAALHAYQRQFRRFDAMRDVRFLSNTWGDRSQDSRINEDFMHAEVSAAARLGVDVVQIDDGWQRGRTANSVQRGGVWEGFWAADPHFWDAHPERLPHGLEPLVTRARELGMEFGLWFAPDSSAEFANWERDAAAVLHLYDTYGVRYFKIDGVKARTRQGEQNLRRFFDRVLAASDGRVVFDLDVTAEVRPGYFGMLQVGPLFVENRYSDFHRYWPHQTLRTLWQLSHWIDPARLRMEFLNNARHVNLYAGDPLAPSCYRPDYLFATTMFANPLGWFEVSNLPSTYYSAVAPLVNTWRQHRTAIFTGEIRPIGEAPDGTSWTGFASIGAEARFGYLLLFRELNARGDATFALPEFAGQHSCTVLAGNGQVSVANGIAHAQMSEPLSFLFARIDVAG